MSSNQRCTAVLIGTSSLVRFAFDHSVLNEVLQ